jgi:hypothetical protein
MPSTAVCGCGHDRSTHITGGPCTRGDGCREFHEPSTVHGIPVRTSVMVQRGAVVVASGPPKAQTATETADDVAVAARCGVRCTSVQDAMDHAATCPVCRVTVQQLREETRPSTLATRLNAAETVLETVHLYRDRVSDAVSGGQVRRLAWAISCLERALWAETGGRYGKEHSHVQSVLARLANTGRSDG